MNPEINIALKKMINDTYGLKTGEMSIVSSGRSHGKSNTQAIMMEYLKQQIEDINEYKSKGYIPIYLDTISATRKEMIEWCIDNCKFNFYVAGSLFMFEDETDAMTFGLVW